MDQFELNRESVMSDLTAIIEANDFAETSSQGSSSQYQQYSIYNDKVQNTGHCQNLYKSSR